MFHSLVFSTRIGHLKWLASLLLIFALTTTGFSAAALPGAFIKSSPTNGAINQLNNPKLSWSASSGATSYEYCIDTSNNNACNVPWKSTGLTTNVTLSGLTPGATYYWQVRAKKGAAITYANGSSAAFWRFTVSLAPGGFNKTSPLDGAVGVKPDAAKGLQPGHSIGTTLKWGTSKLATSYEYCFDTVNDKVCNVPWKSVGTSTSVTLNDLKLGTSYYWQVRARNATGTTYANGSSTAWWKLTIAYTYRDMTVGFLQAGSGSTDNWGAANTLSFKETAAELGIRLKFHDSGYNLADQQTAFHNFVLDPDVNVIVLRATDSSGWDALLQQAKNAHKVVVLDDANITASQSLYATRISSDFVEEGRKAGTEMCNLLSGGSISKNVVELAGTAGVQAAIDRAAGFREMTDACGIDITHSQVADWDYDTGKSVMASILASDTDIVGVFAQNDNMGLGAIQAIKDAGLTPGVGGIQIVSVDAIHDAFLAMIAGELNVSVECNPLIAPQAYEAALGALNSEPLSKWIHTDETVFYATQGQMRLTPSWRPANTKL